MLRALGRIYHAKNLHSARSHFKGRGTVFLPASGEEGRGKTTVGNVRSSPGVTEIGGGCLKKRRSSWSGTKFFSVNTAVFLNLQKTERNNGWGNDRESLKERKTKKMSEEGIKSSLFFLFPVREMWSRKMVPCCIIISKSPENKCICVCAD